MALWHPDPSKPIGRAEHVGRRLFDEPQLAGSVGQKTYGRLDLRNFEETRGDEFSLDRLGHTGFDKRVAKYLQPLAEGAGRKFRVAKKFDGWAVVPTCALVDEGLVVGGTESAALFYSAAPSRVVHGQREFVSKPPRRPRFANTGSG